MQTADTSSADLLQALPNALVTDVLMLCPTPALASAAQTSRRLLTLTAQDNIWPSERLQGLPTAFATSTAQLHRKHLLITQIQLVLASVLHLPPQVFPVKFLPTRSTRFPIEVPLHSLRSALGVVDVHELASEVSAAVQSAVTSSSRTNKRSAEAQDLRNALALVDACRADRGSVRIAVHPAAAVYQVLRYSSHLRTTASLQRLWIYGDRVGRDHALRGKGQHEPPDAHKKLTNAQKEIHFLLNHHCGPQQGNVVQQSTEITLPAINASTQFQEACTKLGRDALAAAFALGQFLALLAANEGIAAIASAAQHLATQLSYLPEQPLNDGKDGDQIARVVTLLLQHADAALSGAAGR